jgi:gliding motility-associated protein GldM
VKEKLKFDNVVARVIPKSTVVVSGESYEADFIVAAYSSTESPTVLLKTGTDKFTSAAGARTLNKASGDVVDGVVHYKVPTGAMGDQKYAGVIQITKDDGEVKSYDFNGAYTVIRPMATLSADKVNVVYKGLQNPMSVSASGFTNDKISLSVSGGGVLTNKGNGKYEFNPTQPNGEVKFTVTGKSMDGKVTNLGSFPFKVKLVPGPTTRISGTVDGGVLDRALLTIKPELTCQLEGFLFDLPPYKVISYEIQVSNPRKNALNELITGSRIPEGTLTRIKSYPAGSKITISNVKTVGIVGATKGSTLAITLN